MKILFTLLLALGAATVLSAHASEPSATRTGIDQIPRAQVQAENQISVPSREIIGSPTQQPRSSEASPQLVTSSVSVTDASQLTYENRPLSVPSQLSGSVRSAQPPQPISRPSEGRTASVERVAGEDRCDPGNRDNKRRKQCATVIESRSAEFSSRDPAELSPEQRLLLEQPLRPASPDLDGVARRLAITGQSDNSLEALGVASMALQQTDQTNNQEKSTENPVISDTAAAVLNAIMVSDSAGASPQR